MTSKKAYIASTALAAALFGTVIVHNTNQEKNMLAYMANMQVPPAPVVTTQVKSESWIPMVRSIGFIEPLQSLSVAIAASGTIEKINFDSGSQVNAGDILIELDSDVEKASLEVFNAQLPALESNYKRDLELAKKNLISPTKLEQSESLFSAMKANIKMAEATLKRRIVKAPFSGDMGLRNIHIGEFINAGISLARLENINDMKVRFSIPQKQLSVIAINDRVDVMVDTYPGVAFAGKISAITPSVVKASGLIEIEATVPNTESLLRSGMYADVAIHQTMIKDAITIPQDAIAFSMSGESVFIVHDTEGKLTVEQRNIKVLERRDNIALVENLSVNDEIVVAGQVGISSGSTVYRTEENFDKNINRNRG